jgi:hypothetical protein
MNDCLPIAYPPINFNFLNTPEVSHIFESLLPTVGAVAETVVYDEEEEVSDEEEEVSDEEEEVSDEEEEEDECIMSMNDAQIDKYIDNIGREPREEVDEWTMDYKGGPILRYSYVNFAGTCLANQQVSNIVIRNAKFTGSTLRNYVFDNVDFYDCDFKGLIVDNVTFRNSTFMDCYLHPNTLESCHVEDNEVEEY